MNPLKTQKTFCVSKHLLKNGWMFLQHWAICWCRRPSVGQTISAAGVSPRVLTIRHQLAAIDLILPYRTWEYVVKSAVYCWLVLFKCQYTTWKYNYFTLFRCFKIVFLTFLYFQLRSVGYTASLKLNFQNWQNWKCLIPRGPFNITGIFVIGLTFSICFHAGHIWYWWSIFVMIYNESEAHPKKNLHL